jgi:FMN-dependent NADH-azoreductase
MPHSVLHIDSSPLGDHSVSRKLTATLLGKLKADHADAQIITRDLVATPLPHLNGITVGAFFYTARST